MVWILKQLNKLMDKLLAWLVPVSCMHGSPQCEACKLEEEKDRMAAGGW